MANPPSKDDVVAGKNAGIRVVAATPQIAQACRELIKMAHQGDYWATRTVKYLSALTSRQMKTVFVRESGKTLDNLPIYVLFVPGIRLEFSQRANSDFVIHHMTLNSTYANLQKSARKPGLFKVTPQKGNFSAKLTDRVAPEKHRIVTISDQYLRIKGGLVPSFHAAKEVSGESIVRRAGFDMHFTPGSRKLGGLRLAQAEQPDSIASIRESALLLAKAMEEARSIEGVYWISEGGGSAILTQAMQLLKSRNIDFKDSEHHVYFSKYGSNLVRAQNLAYDINLQFERKAYSGGLTSRPIDAIRAPLNRRKREPDNYSRLQMTSDFFSGPQAAIGGVALLSGMGIGGTGAFIVGAGVAGFTAIAALSRAVTPNSYEKIKGKL